MKLIKDFSRIALVAALACSFALTSCKKDEEEDCGALLEKISTTTQAYATDASIANCKAYKAALQAYVNSGCDNSNNDSYELVISVLDCE